MSIVYLLRDAIDDPRLSNPSSPSSLGQGGIDTPLKQLENRVWLLHWSLFVFYRVPNGHNALIEFFLGNERYLRAIEMKAPWMLRYIVISAIVTKNQHNNHNTTTTTSNTSTTSSTSAIHPFTHSTSSSRLKDIIKLVEQESHTYSLSDPVTLFIKTLYGQCDFAQAHKILQQAQNVLVQDFFVSNAKPLNQPSSGPLSTNSSSGVCRLLDCFIQESRVAICETYCKIHHRINIATVLAQLHGGEEASTTGDTSTTEKWIVNLIRNLKLDAKIDAANKQVVITNTATSMYQLLLDKTRTMTLRASVLASSTDIGIQHYTLTPPAGPTSFAVMPESALDDEPRAAATLEDDFEEL